MANRVETIEQAADAFNTLADSEEPVIPTYARICRIIAADPRLHRILLEAPVGQRLPVLVLAAIHDLVLEDPYSVLRPWYPNVSGEPPSGEDPTDALGAFVEDHRAEIIDLVRTRTVQTNEVNRSVAWRLLLGQITAEDRRPLHLIELGTSAGLNLNLDAYGCDISFGNDDDAQGGDAGLRPLAAGPDNASLRLRVLDTAGQFTDPAQWQLDAPIVARVGIDESSLDMGNAADVRWLKACTWPEQTGRFDSLELAIEVVQRRPVDIRRGDMVDDISDLLDEVADNSHAVLLSSWALAYVSRPRRAELLTVLQSCADELARRHSRLTLLTLESARVLDWITVPPPPQGSAPEIANASILARTDFGARAGEQADRTGPTPGPTATPVARCHAHMWWIRPL